MFGYVRPLRCDLRVCEWERFQAAYCGLCHTLARRYGFWARYLLNYDLTVLSLSLSAYEPPQEMCGKRCPASPFVRKSCYNTGDSVALAADLTILLSAGRLRDNVADRPFLSGLPSRLALFLLSGAFRRAIRRRPAEQALMARELAHLSEIEKEKINALDPAADAFATLLAGLADGLPDPAGRRVLGRLFYHLGRWIYLIDACDDLPADVKDGAYNPVAARFALTDGCWTPEARDAMRDTLCLSRMEMETALTLLPDAPCIPILENIFRMGLPHVEEQVLSGRWRKGKNRHERSI